METVMYLAVPYSKHSLAARFTTLKAADCNEVNVFLGPLGGRVRDEFSAFAPRRNPTISKIRLHTRIVSDSNYFTRPLYSIRKVRKNTSMSDEVRVSRAFPSDRIRTFNLAVRAIDGSVVRLESFTIYGEVPISEKNRVARPSALPRQPKTRIFRTRFVS